MKKSRLLRWSATSCVALACLFASPGDAAAQIRLRVIADPPGADEKNLNGEVVTITNRLTVPLDLSGWSLCDAMAACFRFVNEVTVGPGASIRVRAGSGQDTLLDVYMGRSEPIWDNWADIATLRDREGVIQSRCVWDRGRGLDCAGQVEMPAVPIPSSPASRRPARARAPSGP